jgi:hypothetical protein
MAHGSRAGEADRYRTAAEETLEQLDWCIHYLYRIRKPEIARSLDKNRRFIEARLRDEPTSRRS